MFVFWFAAGDYFLALGIRFFAFGMIDFLLAGIFGNLSADIPDRIEEPSMPTLISGDPIFIDDDILFSVGVLTLFQHGICEGVGSLSDDLWLSGLLVLS
jgi:hypothetical protein